MDQTENNEIELKLQCSINNDVNSNPSWNKDAVTSKSNLKAVSRCSVNHRDEAAERGYEAEDGQTSDVLTDDDGTFARSQNIYI